MSTRRYPHNMGSVSRPARTYKRKLLPPTAGPRDILAFAEQYRNFYFIPGNTYNPDVVEKVHLAEALLRAVDELKQLCHTVKGLWPKGRTPEEHPSEWAMLNR